MLLYVTWYQWKMSYKNRWPSEALNDHKNDKIGQLMIGIRNLYLTKYAHKSPFPLQCHWCRQRFCSLKSPFPSHFFFLATSMIWIWKYGEVIVSKPRIGPWRIWLEKLLKRILSRPGARTYSSHTSCTDWSSPQCNSWKMPRLGWQCLPWFDRCNVL